MLTCPSEIVRIQGPQNRISAVIRASDADEPSARVHGSFHSAHVTAHHHGHQPRTDLFFADQSYVRSFHHRVSRFDGAD